MTMFDELIDLLADVGRRDCLVYVPPCGLDECEPCRSRALYARMVEARDRVSPQDDAVRATPVADAVATARPGTWVATNADGEVRRVVPKGPHGQYTLAMPEVGR